MWWDSLNSTYRATSCLLLSFFLMWQATKAAEHDRRFFLTGMIALALLGYGAFTFVQGNGGAQ